MSNSVSESDSDNQAKRRRREKKKEVVEEEKEENEGGRDSRKKRERKRKSKGDKKKKKKKKEKSKNMHKDKKRKKKKKKDKKGRDRTEKGKDQGSTGPVLSSVQEKLLAIAGVGIDKPRESQARILKPMTKEEYEKEQSVTRRVFDQDTGRTRLVKGSGEIIEEIVSRDRHKAINKQATKADGMSFQSQLRLL
ncbi:putative ADP-ribosylation factor-like protein 6-interacting protein 4 isoform X2 [Apostichopus japonicus]|uniref:ADP-ribosylation factor-like protein 6-interacting protein 4 n=1 Tax=Stichopus japonicus TaxID=307972 RepID=A0A2G8KF95_STIJA|nr:putative ADP-ribosylation factor-like protein 6-interacting protein 4 isoform X2 [Apostichopus japonicus]